MFSVFWWCLKYLITGADLSTTTFDRLPSDVLRNIFGNLPIGDRVRMRLVSKSWRDVLVRTDYPVKPEPPWLILRVSTTEFSFESMSEKRTYRFKFPSSSGGTVCGSCGGGGPRYQWGCCGSSSDGGGWLLMAGRRAGDDLSKTEMILWDPISGTTKRLPALSTLPFFRRLVDTCKRAGIDIFSTPVVIARAQVFSVGSVECVVAVAFSDILSSKLRRIALCSPEDQSWKIVPYGPDREYYKDILFHDGRLYTICKASSGVRRSRNCTVGLSCCDVEVTKLEIKHVGAVDYERWNEVEYLVRSSAGGGRQLLVVSAVLDQQPHDGTTPYAYTQTRGFEVFGLDVVNGNNCLERLRNVGKQCLFVGATGSTSVEAEAGGVDLGNIIHFATNDADGLYYDYELLVVHERGVFDVARDKIKTRFCRHFCYDETRSCAGWFTPKLCSL